MEFKDVFNKLRLEKNLSFAQIASEFNKSESAVRAWESGRTKPDADTLIELSKYFDCSTDYLLGLDANKNKESLSGLSDELSEFGDLLSRIDNTSGLLFSLKWILLAPEYIRQNKLFLTKDFSIIVRCFRTVILNMADASIKTVSMVTNGLHDAKSFSELGATINSCKKLSCSAISLFFTELMGTASESAQFNANSNEAEAVKDVFYMYLSSIDFDALKNDIESVDKERSWNSIDLGKSEVEKQAPEEK